MHQESACADANANAIALCPVIPSRVKDCGKNLPRQPSLSFSSTSVEGYKVIINKLLKIILQFLSTLAVDSAITLLELLLLEFLILPWQVEEEYF
jgi:hypothetical protein